ncbi:MAG: hypothetical protein ABR607_01150 [Pyrinomonadaceae bacterium]
MNDRLFASKRKEDNGPRGGYRVSPGISIRTARRLGETVLVAHWVTTQARTLALQSRSHPPPTRLPAWNPVPT